MYIILHISENVQLFMFVYPSVRLYILMEKLCSNWTNFH